MDRLISTLPVYSAGIASLRNQPTLVYGSPPIVGTVQYSSNQPLIIKKGNETVVKQEDDLPYDIEGIMREYFTGMASNSIPKDLYPYREVIDRVYKDSGRLAYVPISASNNGERGISFLKATDLPVWLYEDYVNREPEYLGYHTNCFLAEVLRIDQNLVEAMTDRSPELVGDLIMSTNKMKRFVNCLIYWERGNLARFIGDTFDYEQNKGYALKYEGENYFAFFEY